MNMDILRVVTIVQKVVVRFKKLFTRLRFIDNSVMIDMHPMDGVLMGADVFWPFHA
jgi:hypothetical protein